MSGAFKLTILTLAVVSGFGCKQIKKSLSDFASAGEEMAAPALPDSESLAGVDGLPVVKRFSTITPSTMPSFIAAGDRISVVEFYSDT